MERSEAILEPDLPIVDPHHHLWDRPATLVAALPQTGHGFEDIIRAVPRYLLDELLADLQSGHNVRATVYLECGAMYRADGPEALRCVGETEFVTGVAAMTASGLYGDVRACAAIVGMPICAWARPSKRCCARTSRRPADAFVASGRARRGMRTPRCSARWRGACRPGSIATRRSATASLLQRLGLSFDTWLLEPQLPDLIDLARAFPEFAADLGARWPHGVSVPNGRRRGNGMRAWCAAGSTAGHSPHARS